MGDSSTSLGMTKVADSQGSHDYRNNLNPKEISPLRLTASVEMTTGREMKGIQLVGLT